MVQLPDELERRLRELSNRQRRPLEETAAEILRRRLMLDRFHDLCRESEALAEAAGYRSEDELLRDVS
ncbi:MAG: hypothetical protein JXQ73_28235 [Phycisphaerae bacterium]|nr:hypothetical protein [Phycisphaerae bacterium]